MHTETHFELTNRLSLQAHREAMRKLCSKLPPPEEETPEAYARRDQAAVYRLSQLVPASVDEVELGADYIANSEYAADCIRQARHAGDLEKEERLQKQAARMGREARGYRATLLRVQAMRMKREANPALAQQSDMLEAASLSVLLAALPQAPEVMAAGPAAAEAAPLVAEAVSAVAGAASPAEPAIQPPEPAAQLPGIEPAPSQTPPPETLSPPETGSPPGFAGPAEPEPAARAPFPPPRPAPPPPRPEPPARHRSRRQSAEDDWPTPDWAQEAERYAIIYPQRAQLIRRLGGLPKNCNFGPPEAPLVRAILRGTSPALLALDDPATVAA